jgi:hypothetical protein
MKKIPVVRLRYSGDVLLAMPALCRIKAVHSGSLQEVRALSHARGQEKAKRDRTVRWIDLMVRPLVVWVKTYCIEQGFRDGVHGLIVSIFASMYTFLKYAKLWDATRQIASHPGVK